MKEKTRKIIIFALLPLAIIWAIYNMNDSKKQTIAPISKEVPSGITKAPDAEKTEIDTAKYSSLPWGNDPFYRARKDRPAPVLPKQKPRWHLSGILFDEINPYAVVNNVVVTEGDTVEGARVVLINKDMVTLEKDGLEIKLKVSKDRS